MIVVRLMGGLGNQLSQYAAARGLSQRLNEKLRFDIGYLGEVLNGTAREYELHHFRHAGRLLNQYEALVAGNLSGRNIFTRCAGKALRIAAGYHFYTEPSLEYDPEFNSLPVNSILSGRFQSYKYFESIRSILLAELKLARSVSRKCSSWLVRAQSEMTVGIHVRRTDYVNNPSYARFITALPLDYYRRAMERIVDYLGPGVQFMIISDDIDWCRLQPIFLKCQHFIDLRGETNPHIEEFEILRNQKHLIIANSTFSWWAASLNEYQNKLVIAPAQWSHHPAIETASRIPPDWIRI